MQSPDADARSIPIRVPDSAALVLRLAEALKIGCAAIHASPAVDEPISPSARTAQAFALTTMQAGVAMAEGRPFDSAGTDLARALIDAREAITDLLYLLPSMATAEGRAKVQRAEFALGAIVRIVGAFDGLLPIPPQPQPGAPA